MTYKLWQAFCFLIVKPGTCYRTSKGPQKRSSHTKTPNDHEANARLKVSIDIGMKNFYTNVTNVSSEA